MRKESRRSKARSLAKSNRKVNTLNTRKIPRGGIRL